MIQVSFCGVRIRFALLYEGAGLDLDCLGIIRSAGSRLSTGVHETLVRTYVCLHSSLPRYA